jgi:hypothetical protein
MGQPVVHFEGRSIQASGAQNGIFSTLITVMAAGHCAALGVLAAGPGIPAFGISI